MTDVADKYAAGDYSEKIQVDSKDEVGRLSSSLQVMANNLTDQIEIANSANKAKSNFLSNMSHEIRSPITAVLGFNEMILREADDKEVLMYSENIRTAGNTLLGLINDILDFSKIEAGKLEIVPVDYDLSSVINDLVNMVKIRADEKGLELETDIDRDIPKYLNGDEIRIKQIITNILTNAVKYTKRGCISFTVGYDRDNSTKDEVCLKVSVQDTGIGIRKEDLDKLFAKFERIEEKKNRNIEGTGLGMSITKSLLEMMGSSLQVDSVYGVGSNFYFSLKQKVVKWEPLGDYSVSFDKYVYEKEKYKSSFTAKNSHVLMVDDNLTNLLVFKNLLKGTLVNIETATSGAEGLALCESKKYDIIFLDHMMPGKDGIETLHELKAMKGCPNSDVPVICLTANAISGAREEYIREGFDDYLTKPIDPVKLEDMMRNYLPDELIDEDSADNASAEDKKKVIASIPDKIKALDESGLFDTKTGILHCVTADGYIEIMESFYGAIDGDISSLNSCVEKEDAGNYAIKAHSIKSTAKTIGATRLGEMALQFELAAKNGDMEFIKKNNASFVDEYKTVKKVLDGVFA
ncbi:MAG: response regulator [Lachnospiraceae bacterium]|nr:response regulator [Lachnospiraceae bacterium]